MKTTSSKMRYFAIRVGDYVIFKSGRVPPKPVPSSITRTVVEKVRKRRTDTSGKITYKTIPRKSKNVLKQTFYEGGTIVGSMKYDTFFWNEFRRMLSPWEMIEIPHVPKRVKL